MVIKQDEEIAYLRDRVRTLEDDIRTYATDIREATATKEELYKNVITLKLASPVNDD